MVYSLLSQHQDSFFYFLSTPGFSPGCGVTTPKYLFTLSFSHTFLPSEPGLGLPAEDVKSNQGVKATVNYQWLEKPSETSWGPAGIGATFGRGNR